MEHCKNTIRELAKKWLQEYDFCECPYAGYVLDRIAKGELNLEQAKDEIDEYVTDRDEIMLGTINLMFKVQERDMASQFIRRLFEAEYLEILEKNKDNLKVLAEEPKQLKLDLIWEDEPSEDIPF